MTSAKTAKNNCQDGAYMAFADSAKRETRKGSKICLTVVSIEQ